jgi:hypothetical protein
MLPLILYQPFDLEFLQVVPNGIEGDTQSRCQVLRSEPLRSLEFHQYHAPHALEAERGRGMVVSRLASWAVHEVES